MKLVLRRVGGIGDCLAATIVAQRLVEQGNEVVFQCHPLTHPVMKRVPNIEVSTPAAGHPDVNLDGAYENSPERFNTHFYELFLRVANAQLRLGGKGPIWEDYETACPVITVYPKNRQAIFSRLSEHPKPWIFICPQSHYRTRHVPDAVWAKLDLTGTMFWLGEHPAPHNIVDLRVRHLDFLVDLLTAANLLITVDTGPMHIATALNVPVVVIKQSFDPKLRLPINRHWAVVEPNLDCLNCQQHKCPINEYQPPCHQVDAKLIRIGAMEMLNLC